MRMASSRKSYVSIIAVLAAILAALTAFVGPAQAATARTITAKAAPTSVFVNTSITLSGTLSKSPRGSAVKIQRYTNGVWVGLATGRTSNAAGAYAVTIRSQPTAGKWIYRAMAPATRTRAAATSRGVTVPTYLKATTTLTATPTTVTSGGSTELAGKVSPSVAGTTAVIQRLSNGTWVTATTAQVSPTGTFGAVVSPSATTTYRAFVPNTGLIASSVSPAVTVTVSVANAPTITTTSLPDGDKGVAYTAQLTKTGGAGTWAVTGGQFPAGLTLDPTSGAITGTPTAGFTYNFTVTFTENGTGLKASKALSILVTPPPTVTTTTLPEATQGTAYSTQLAKTGKDGTWKLLPNTVLPAGLSLSPSGLISGTPTAAAGTYAVYVVFTETSTNRSAGASLALKINPGTVTPPTGPTITTTSLPDGDKDVFYTATLAKTGGAGTWSLTPGSSLPTGLSLDPTTGVISGTPTAGGTVAFTVRFTETTGGATATKALSIAISPPPTITTTTLPDAVQGRAYTATLTKTGKAGTWSLTPGTSLPSGLALDPTTGVISGNTSVPVGSYGIYPVFTETSTNRAVGKALSLTVVADTVIPPGTVAITTTSLPDADRGVTYSTTLTTNGGAGTWSIIAGALPAGITLSPSMGVLSGTPTAGGTANFTVKFVQASNGATATKSFSLVVTPPPTITTTSLPDATRGTPYSTQLTANGKAGTWRVITSAGNPTGLPAGLSISSSGLLSGTPTAAPGTYGVYPVFTETSTGRTAAAAFALVIKGDGVAVTTATLPDATTGTAYSQQLTKTGLAGTWEQTSGFLPSGITLSSAGVLAGTPTETGDFPIQVRFTETSTGSSATKNLVLHVSAPGSPTITTTTLPNAKVGTPYSAQLAATPTGGTWSITYASLPVGLTLNPTTGAITGTPQFAENAVFQVTYTRAGTKNTRLLNLNALPAG